LGRFLLLDLLAEFLETGLFLFFGQRSDLLSRLGEVGVLTGMVNLEQAIVRERCTYVLAAWKVA